MNISAGVEKKDTFIKKFLRRIGSLMGLVLVWVVSLFICYGAIIYFEAAVELANHSASTQATIMYRSRCTYMSSINNQPAIYGWRLVLQFKDARSISYFGEEQEAFCHRSNSIDVTQPIKVYYLPRNPAFFTAVDPTYPLINNLLFDILAALWMLALTFVVTPIWLWLTFSSTPEAKEETFDELTPQTR